MYRKAPPKVRKIGQLDKLDFFDKLLRFLQQPLITDQPLRAAACRVANWHNFVKQLRGKQPDSARALRAEEAAKRAGKQHLIDLGLFDIKLLCHQRNTGSNGAFGQLNLTNILLGQIYLTQEDIREVQLAKGAIAAGIALMAKQLDIEQSQIDQVLLAGAFGSFLRPESACRIGLLPPELLDKIVPVGNAAGSGAKRLVCDERLLEEAQKLVEKIEFIELADLPDFRRCFSVHMGL